jgi:hypothetical protein
MTRNFLANKQDFAEKKQEGTEFVVCGLLSLAGTQKKTVFLSVDSHENLCGYWLLSRSERGSAFPKAFSLNFPFLALGWK